MKHLVVNASPGARERERESENVKENERERKQSETEQSRAKPSKTERNRAKSSETERNSCPCPSTSSPPLPGPPQAGPRGPCSSCCQPERAAESRTSETAPHHCLRNEPTYFRTMRPIRIICASTTNRSATNTAVQRPVQLDRPPGDCQAKATQQPRA